MCFVWDEGCAQVSWFKEKNRMKEHSGVSIWLWSQQTRKQTFKKTDLHRASLVIKSLIMKEFPFDTVVLKLYNKNMSIPFLNFGMDDSEELPIIAIAAIDLCVTCVFIPVVCTYSVLFYVRILLRYSYKNKQEKNTLGKKGKSLNSCRKLAN